jgi:hypothetical protein
LSGRTAISLVIIFAIIVLTLYEVSFDVRFEFARQEQRPDPAVEAEYARCFEQKDKDMHSVAFGTIDNPDVQKEFIIANREIIRRECRQRFSEKLITVTLSSCFNLVDLRARFW